MSNNQASIRQEHYDKKYIKRCIKLAKNGGGFVSPNPLVGAVIVKNERIIGEGWHAKYGGAHAEVNALENASDDVKGATLYCNLEPCCHLEKQTPPCVPFIISSGIKRVVVSCLDSNPDVNGLGIQLLNESGIKTDVGILRDESEELNKFYYKYITHKIPYVTIKIAQSLDGKISFSRNEQTWLTSKKAIRFVHELRAGYDAVVVGANTIKVDNPFLNVREVKGRNPVRIIIDGKLSIPFKANVLKAEDINKTWIFTDTNADRRKLQKLKSMGVNIFKLKPGKSGSIDFSEVLKTLGEKKITSVLVEGGEQIFSQFISKDLFDEIIILQSPRVLGKGLSGITARPPTGLEYRIIEKLGDDLKLILKRKK
ncbi:riboflavin biosynthesis protein RibD [bacterium BMS3Abin03]|nr:riboflavin biosynthesis protein RibD [bacterium BMS3Abin03]